MYSLDLSDILFLMKCLKDNNDTINIVNFIPFIKCCIRTGSAKRLQHSYCHTSTSHNFYFNHVILLWNLLPVIDLNQSFSFIKCIVLAHLWNHFRKFFDGSNHCKLSYTCPCLNALIIQERRGLVFRKCVFVYSYVNLVLVYNLHMYLHISWAAVYQHLQCNGSYSHLKSCPHLCMASKPLWTTSTWDPSLLGSVSPGRQWWTQVGVPEKTFLSL